MQITYRVQEYIRDGNIFFKGRRYHLPAEEYRRINCESTDTRLLIVPRRDWCEKKMPETFFSYDKLAALISKCEKIERRRLLGEESLRYIYRFGRSEA